MKSTRKFGHSAPENELEELRLELHTYVDAERANVKRAAEKSAVIHAQIEELKRLREVLDVCDTDVDPGFKWH